MGLFSFLYERVFHIQIYGGINHRMTEHLVKALRYKNLYSVQLIAVSINSIGGSLTQAKNINAILKNLSNKTGAPVYTFAEDACLHTANAILAAGNKSFANEFSIIGDYAFHLETYGVKGLLNNYGVQVETLASGEQKDRLNMFEDLREKDKKWVQHLLYEGEYELKSEILKYRSNSFQQLRLSNENVEEKIFSPPVLTSKTALQNGVIDGIATLDKVLHERYPDVKVAEIMKGFTNTQSPKHSAQAAVNTVSSMFQLNH